jgi:uncharacterized protein YdaU (DUF1376 family)
MNHYPHHIGDFDRATRHLTRIERSVYRDLLDMYYDTEKPLPKDLGVVCRKIIARTNEESTAVEQVLNEFFILTEQGWFNSRCDSEIESYKTNNSQKAIAGKASAAAKALKKQQVLNGESTAVEQPLNSRYTDEQQTNNGTSTNQNQNHTNNNTRASFEKIETQGEYVAKPVRELFNMTLDWKPNQQTFAAITMRNGLPAEYSDDRLAGFVSYWQAEPIELTQGQWENKYATYLKRPVLVPKEPKPKSSPKNSQPQYDEYITPPLYVKPPPEVVDRPSPEQVKENFRKLREVLGGA